MEKERLKGEKKKIRMSESVKDNVTCGECGMSFRYDQRKEHENTSGYKFYPAGVDSFLGGQVHSASKKAEERKIREEQEREEARKKKALEDEEKKRKEAEKKEEEEKKQRQLEETQRQEQKRKEELKKQEEKRKLEKVEEEKRELPNKQTVHTLDDTERNQRSLFDLQNQRDDLIRQRNRVKASLEEINKEIKEQQTTDSMTQSKINEELINQKATLRRSALNLNREISSLNNLITGLEKPLHSEPIFADCHTPPPVKRKADGSPESYGYQSDTEMCVDDVTYFRTEANETRSFQSTPPPSLVNEALNYESRPENLTEDFGSPPPLSVANGTYNIDEGFRSPPPPIFMNDGFLNSTVNSENMDQDISSPAMSVPNEEWSSTENIQAKDISSNPTAPPPNLRSPLCSLTLLPNQGSCIPAYKQKELESHIREISNSLRKLELAVSGNSNISSLPQAPPVYEGTMQHSTASTSRNEMDGESATSETNPKQAYEDKLQDWENRRKLASSARSIDEISKHLPHIQPTYANDLDRTKGKINGLECTKCTSSGKNVKANYGRFSYDGSGETSFPKNTRQTDEFRNLKKDIIRHEKTSVHKSLLQEETGDQSYIPEQAENKAAVNVGMLAYKSVKDMSSQKQFEQMLSLAQHCGANIGDINHSREFARNFTTALDDTLMEKSREILDRPLPATGLPSPISVVADKVTLNNRTYQPVGVNAIIDGKIKTILSDMPVVDQHDGKHIAETIKSSVEKLVPNNIEQRFTGGSFDGQYIKNNVGRYLTDKVLPTSDEEASKFHSYTWCQMHQLELAEQDAKKSREGDVIKNVEKTVTDVQKDYSYSSKNYEQLMKEQRENDQKLLSPLSFSTTKFASHSANALKNFNNNYPAHYDVLSKEQKDKADKINNAEFVCSLNGAMDSYKKLSEISKQVQSAERFPWEVDKTIQNGIKHFRDMAQDLKTGNYNSELCPNFGSAVSEMREDMTYKGKPVFVKKQHIRSSRSQTETQSKQDSIQSQSSRGDFDEVVNRTANKLAKFNEKFANSFEKRVAKSASDVTKLSGEVFSRDRVLNSSNIESRITSLQEYATMAKSAGVLDKSVSPEQLDSQYRTFSDNVKNIHARNSNVSEQKMYGDYLMNSTNFNTTKDVAHLLATSMVRASSEAACESMASIGKSIFQNRGTLKPESLNKEIRLKWNGPPAGPQADKLIRASLTKHFKGENWHFHRKTADSRPDKLKPFEVSKVVDRVDETQGRINFD